MTRDDFEEAVLIKSCPVVTTGARSEAERLGINLVDLFKRHASKDWGKMCKTGIDHNNTSLLTRERIMSVYNYEDVTFWVITDAGWEVVTVLLPSEY